MKNKRTAKIDAEDYERLKREARKNNRKIIDMMRLHIRTPVEIPDINIFKKKKNEKNKNK